LAPLGINKDDYAVFAIALQVKVLPLQNLIKHGKEAGMVVKSLIINRAVYNTSYLIISKLTQILKRSVVSL
jgi:hypothetical protein